MSVKCDKVWQLRGGDTKAARQLASKLGMPGFLGQILVNRGIAQLDTARRFLAPQLTHLSDPRGLPGVPEAARRMDEAVRARQRILIYGDYDVDGTAAVAVLYRLLRLAGADVTYYVPSRLEEGYGLNMDAMTRIRDSGVQLVVTVDCGISAIEEAAFLAKSGIDLIVTDHHEPSDQLPEAAAIVDPKLEIDDLALRDLSGVGVAFKLAWAVGQAFSRDDKVSPEFRDLLVDSLALVALGTIADVVPLMGENRVLVAFGLAQLSRSQLPGLRALIEASGVRDTVTSQNVAFALAPRLNAAGRMGHAREAIELFISEDMEDARRLAKSLEEQNALRQREQRLIFHRALALIGEDETLADERAIVLVEESWHSGVIGIVASRVVDEFHRPTVIISMQGDTGQGSARSIPRLNLFETLTAVQDTLLSYGGHSQAAGLRVAREQLPAFRRAFLDEVRGRLPAEALRPVLNVDAEVTLGDITLEATAAIDQLQPFGHGNRPPILCARDAAVVGAPSRVGKEGKHLVMTLKQNQTALRAVAFGKGDLLDDVAESRRVDVAFVPTVNRFRNGRTAELRIEDMVIH